MAELLRDIGALEARMDDHDRRFDTLEGMVTKGFEETKNSISELRNSESRRKGALGIVKIALGAGGLAGLWELAKEFLHR